MKNYFLNPLIVLALLTAYSCANNKGTSTGNPLVALTVTGATSKATSQLNKQHFPWWLNEAYALNPPSNMLDAANNSITLSDFWISISKIELKQTEIADASEIDGTDIQFTGPYTINILNPSPSHIASSQLTVNSIRRIKYKIKKVTDLKAGNPSGMVNYSLYISGSVAGKNFVIRSGEEVEYQISGPKLVTLSNNQNLLLEILTAEIFRKIDLTHVSNNDIIDENNKITAPSACPTIDSSANDIYTCFTKAIQQQTKAGKDDNDNYVLDPTEDSIN